jgi:hypothetical protein
MRDGYGLGVMGYGVLLILRLGKSEGFLQMQVAGKSKRTVNWFWEYTIEE